MVWATLGFVLVIIFWGVVNLVAQSTGLDADGNNFNDNALNNVDLNRTPPSSVGPGAR